MIPWALWDFWAQAFLTCCTATRESHHTATKTQRSLKKKGTTGHLVEEKSFWKGPSKKRDLLELGGAFQVALVVKNPPANAGDIRDTINPWVGKIP